jgi:hypothetical protein
LGCCWGSLLSSSSYRCGNTTCTSLLVAVSSAEPLFERNFSMFNSTTALSAPFSLSVRLSAAPVALRLRRMTSVPRGSVELMQPGEACAVPGAALARVQSGMNPCAEAGRVALAAVCCVGPGAAPLVGHRWLCEEPEAELWEADPADPPQVFAPLLEVTLRQGAATSTVPLKPYEKAFLSPGLKPSFVSSMVMAATGVQLFPAADPRSDLPFALLGIALEPIGDSDWRVHTSEETRQIRFGSQGRTKEWVSEARQCDPNRVTRTARLPPKRTVADFFKGSLLGQVKVVKVGGGGGGGTRTAVLQGMWTPPEDTSYVFTVFVET